MIERSGKRQDLLKIVELKAQALIASGIHFQKVTANFPRR